jgi:preprotein translocase SecF subunit
MQYFDKTNIDFVSKRIFFTYFSSILNVVGVILFLFILPLQLGIDFKGGAEIAVAFEKTIDIHTIRKSVETTGMKGSEIKSFGTNNQFLIRVSEIEAGPDKVTNAFNKSFPNNKFKMLKVDKIGPKMGSEMFTSAVIAVFLAFIAMLIYIAFRFEFIYGVGAIVALVHDVIVTLTLIVIVHYLGIIDIEVNQSFIAGILTVVGYSMNDTVIVFDRIRENKEKHKGLNIDKMVNLSVNETLSRTINTVATVVGVLLILVLFGGPVLQSMAFIMFIGIVTGTYSSVYIASNFVIMLMHKREAKVPPKKVYTPVKAH